MSRRLGVTTVGAVLLGVGAAAVGSGTSTSPRQVPARSASSLEQESGFRSGRASFSLRLRGLQVPYRRFFVAALPGDTVRIRVAGRRSAETRLEARLFDATAAGGALERLGLGSWRWTAPDRSGRQRIVIRRRAREGVPADSVILQAFVLVPRNRLEGGALEGYRMGTFPTPAYRGLDQYRPPRGFIRLTRENAAVRVSPHFRLGQFPVKRPREWPKYLPLGPKLILKLELMLEEANRRGIRASGFRVMSGYRSPWYNTELLGRPRYSRHIYGDAADVFVDENNDGAMDDLNGDGRITIADAQVLYRMVEEMDRAPETRHLRGGLWKYRRTSSHPPFIHVDTRGFIAR